MSTVSTLSKILARLHRWYPAAWLLSRVPLTQLDATSIGRLSYALMMANRSSHGKTHALLASVVRRNSNTTPELRIELAAMATAVGDAALADTLLTHAAQTSTDAHTSNAAQRLLTVNRAFAGGSLTAQLREAVDALHLMQATEPLTLVPLSLRYFDLWQLWLKQVRKHVGGTVIVMAMDDPATAAAQLETDVTPLDMREFFAWDAKGSLHPRSRGVLWLLRVLVLRELVRRGHTTLVLDLDAIPVGDLAPMLANLPTADVVAQKDHSLPMDVDRHLGFVLCCGFMLWRPTAAAIALLDRFVTETAMERDDQMALNHILAREGLGGRTEDAHSMSFRSAGAQFVCPDPSLVSRTLHSGSVVRHFQQEGKSIADLQQGLRLR